jgi:hypothetical protein
LISIEDFKKEFERSEAWVEGIQHVQRLLELPIFKVLVCNNKTVDYFEEEISVPSDLRHRYISKLDVGALALLWCDGTQEEKVFSGINLIFNTNLDFNEK